MPTGSEQPAFIEKGLSYYQLSTIEQRRQVYEIVKTMI